MAARGRTSQKGTSVAQAVYKSEALVFVLCVYMYLFPHRAATVIVEPAFWNSFSANGLY